MGIFDKFEWDPDNVPGVKLGLHCMQIIFGFVIFVLEIILFKDGEAQITGNNGWPFGLVCTAPSSLALHGLPPGRAG